LINHGHIDLIGRDRSRVINFGCDASALGRVSAGQRTLKRAAAQGCSVPSRHSQSTAVVTCRSHTYDEQKRRAEGKDSGDEGRDDCPDNHRVQKCAGLAKTRVRIGGRKIAPHPADHDQMREEHHRKAQPQRAGRPGKSATNGVDRVENNDRDAPNAEARHEPPEAPEWNGKRAHGRAPSIVTSAGNARTRPSAMAPVITV